MSLLFLGDCEFLDTDFGAEPSLQTQTSKHLSQLSELQVGQALQAITDERTFTDEERERHIASCGELAIRAMHEGDPVLARQWTAWMYEAIQGRSEAKKAQMEADIQRRIDEGVGYFNSDAAQELGRRAMR